MSNNKLYLLDAMISFLQGQMDKGNLWAAYEGYNLPKDEYELKLFGSSLEAEKFCSDNLFATDIEDGSTIELNYNYHATENLLEQYRYLHNPSAAKPLADFKFIEALLEGQGIEIDSDDSDLRAQQISELAYGRIVPALRSISFVPAEKAISYLLILHHHQYHPVFYELGHTFTVLESFSTLQEAEAAFKIKADDLSPENMGCNTTLSLICSFQEDAIPFSIEGHPQYNSGEILASAYYFDDGLEIEHVCDANVPGEYYKQFFIKLDSGCQRILTLDDRLRELADPDSIKSYWSSGYFSIFGAERIIKDK